MFIWDIWWYSHTVHSSSSTSLQFHTGNCWKSGIMQCKVCFRNCQYMVMGGAVIYFYFHLRVFDWNLMTFYQYSFGYLQFIVDSKNMSNSNCSWYLNSLKTCFWSDWVDLVSLQYVYCHHYDSNSFSDMTQFSVL